MNLKHFVVKTVECGSYREAVFMCVFHTYTKGRDYMPSISQIYVHVIMLLPMTYEHSYLIFIFHWGEVF